MADYLVTDTELTSVANAIRTKGGTSANLSFPTEFVSAINDIPTGSEPTGTKYIYTDETDITEAFDVGGYKYCSIDYAPVKDGHTRYWIDIPSNSLTFRAPIESPSLFYAYTGMINWGDGSPLVEFNTNNFNSIRDHTYASAGRYCFEVWVVSGDEGYVHFTSGTTTYRDKMRAIELYVPNATSQIFQFTNYTTVEKIAFTSNATKVTVYNCTSLKEVSIPNTTTEIGSFYGNSALEHLVVPASVTKVTSFKNNSSMKEYHFKSTTPPSTSNLTNIFDGNPSDFKIYVPTASVSAYQSATEWINYSSHIQGE